MVDIILYNYFGAPNVLEKTLYEVSSESGVLNAEFDVLNPIIRFRTQNIVAFNYVYIKALQRYYFVTDIKQEGDICKVYLKVDVLHTYKEHIKKLKGVLMTTKESSYNNTRDVTYNKKPQYSNLSFNGESFNETGSLIMVTIKGNNE